MEISIGQEIKGCAPTSSVPEGRAAKSNEPELSAQPERTAHCSGNTNPSSSLS